MEAQAQGAAAPPADVTGHKRKAESELQAPLGLDGWFQPRDEDLDMTIEQFLKARVDKMQQEYREFCSRTTKRLRRRCAEYSAMMLEGLEDMQATASAEADAGSAPAAPVARATSKKKGGSKATKKGKSGKSSAISMVLKCIAGAYKGQEFALELKSRRVCRLGRSTGKTFVANGVSLPNDVEVSTTHGKFGVKGGSPYFTDVGSSNGTELNGVELTPNQSAKLKQGDVLIVGTTHLQVCFPGDVDETAAGEENVAAVKSSE